MATRKILTISEDEKILRKKAKKVERVDVLTRKLLDDMMETIEDIGYGLAAPQVGILKRLIVVRTKDDRLKYKLINPKIVKKSEDMVCATEGCLSVPDLVGDVDRHESIVVKATDPKGKNIKIEAEGLLARVFQHEIDHLDGTLYIDKADNIREPEDEEESEEAEI